MKAVRIEHNESCSSTYRFETHEEAKVFIRDLFENARLNDVKPPVVWLLDSDEYLGE